jgi:pSer/pThr/pTyr-binding forkhead associated (FHA) protein
MEFLLTNWLQILIGVVVIILVGVVLAFTFRSRTSKAKLSMEDQDLEIPDQTPGGEGFTAPAEERSGGVGPPDFGLQLVMDDDQVFHLDLPSTLGRSAENNFEITDDSVSYRHARIFFDRRIGAVCIEDLNSLNGIFVDGRPTTKSVLVDGARLTVGGVSFTFRDTGYLPPNR